jgi:uncharacterized membrane protein
LNAIAWLLAALAYLAAIVITVVGNIPLNNSLAGLDPHAAGAPAQRSSFGTRWAVWSSLRGLAAMAGSAVFIVALLRK